jgi:hypothetical protein
MNPSSPFLLKLPKPRSLSCCYSKEYRPAVLNSRILWKLSCYDSNTGPVLAAVPVVTTEIGEDDCQGVFISTLMGWLDNNGGSYLAWVWDTWGSSCGSISLISDYSGTPNGAYGQTYKDHLSTLSP